MPAPQLKGDAHQARLDAEASICAILRGESIPATVPVEVAELAVSEGVAPLLWKSATLPALPSPVTETLQHDVRRQLALAAVREPELRRVLDAFGAAGIDVLLVKGAHVAYAFYDAPALRPRNDTDLFVRPGCEDDARRVLAALGYRYQPAITGVEVQGQSIFEHERLPGTVLDVHSRLASPIVAAQLFDFDDLWRRARLIPALGPHARGPHLHDAIAIAAVHLLAHHPTERGLLWLYDLHVLSAALLPTDVDAVIAAAQSRRMTTVLAAALARSHARFPSAASGALLARLPGDESEPSAALLGHRGAAGQALLDVRALRTWRGRRAYLAAHLFPPPDYMRRRYAPGSQAPLAWLYARRIIRGARRWTSKWLVNEMAGQ